MKTMRTWVGCGVGVLLWSACFSEAAPSLSVTKPPVILPTLMTGPPADPTASQGQWFIDNRGTETVRTNEFHDDGAGGLGANAITGYVDSITYLGGPGTPIVGFSLQATIHNDTTVEAGWAAGANSHGEQRPRVSEELPYVGPLLDAKLAAEFAIGDASRLPIGFNYPAGPYREAAPFIEAVNEDQWGWYCWNPEDPDPEHKPAGGYFVPTWDFGTIPQGQSATRQLVFTVAAPGLQPADPRYVAIVASYTTLGDILLNRSRSLKISTWIDDLALDQGAQQEEPPPLRLSDVSVFHNPFKEEEPEELDFGDAPDAPYPTLLANDGARHVIVPGIFMGAQIDAELDGQPNPTATGDDLTNFPDEDGVTFLGPIFAGQTVTVAVNCSTSGLLFAWVDFDANGAWGDFGENVVAASPPMTQGLNYVSFGVPASAAIGPTFARFRFTTLPVSLTYTGLVADGEVEDYPIDIQQMEEPELDFGDATDSLLIPGGYPTYLVNNGARHVLVPGVCLGAAIDAEPDGQPDGTATGDDKAGIDDEDGVTIQSPLVAGSVAGVQVTASVPGFLNAWIDYNGNGTWSDPGEQVYLNQPLAPGPQWLQLPLPVPPAIVSGGPQSRWRFTTYPPAAPSFSGAESDGEVEDYEVRMEVLDFGDAPDPTYPTLYANDGARHLIPATPTVYLGAVAPDLSVDGQPTAAADGDDANGVDDEDGVFVGAGQALVRGDPSALLGVVASAPGILNAWLDFNGDGDWADGGEQIAGDRSLPAGVSPLSFAIPADAQVGPVVGRFRFASAAGLSYTGLANDGEVEDHEFTIYQRAPDTNAFWITNVAHTATNEITIEWTGDTNAVFETQYIFDLPSTASPPWTAWGPWVSAPPLLQRDTNATTAAKHYRVVAPFSPPPP